MKRLSIFLAGLLALAAATQVLAGECPAARAMKDGEKEFNAHLEAIERQEWLLLEYLSSDGSQKSKELLAEEYGRYRVYQGQMAELAEVMKKVPEGTPEIPEDGTPACDASTRVKEIAFKFLDDREAALKKYYGDGYLFILGCDLVAVNLLELSHSLNKPDSKLDPKLMLTMAKVALEYPMEAAKLKPADFEKLASEMFQPSQLPARIRYSYAGLRCLRDNQGAEIQPLAAASEALAKCETKSWGKLGDCVVEATRMPSQPAAGATKD